MEQSIRRLRRGGQRCIVFAGTTVVASGTVEGVRRTLGERNGSLAGHTLRAFDQDSGEQIAIAPRQRARGGRPELGVDSGSVQLLPRHWRWLAEQPGGTSACLRRLLDQAMALQAGADPAAHAAAAVERFARALEPAVPGIDQVCEAVRRGDRAGAAAVLRDWPPDARRFAESLAGWSRRPAAGGEGVAARRRGGG